MAGWWPTRRTCRCTWARWKKPFATRLPRIPTWQPGDVIATNDPYAGGSHLPDITVITPVHDSATGELLFFTANRAHHAEIGGMVPGSMPPLSKKLADEGVLIRNFKLVAAGESRFDSIRDLLLSAPLSDARCCRKPGRPGRPGRRQSARRERFARARASDTRWPVVERYMNYVQDAAEQKVRLALSSVAGWQRTDLPITWKRPMARARRFAVEFTIHDAGQPKAATIDFTGTGPVIDGNLNANRAIVTAAVIYVLRLLVDEDIPLNHGVLRPIEIVLPTCLLNPPPGDRRRNRRPRWPAATWKHRSASSTCCLGALGVAGASQGTMNNVVFGDASFGYYETICGGSGATADGPGASAVQVHMTNTRLTDPEMLERRYPGARSRVLRFAAVRAVPAAIAAATAPCGDWSFCGRSRCRCSPSVAGRIRRTAWPAASRVRLAEIGLQRADGTVVELPGIAQVASSPGRCADH